MKSVRNILVIVLGLLLGGAAGILLTRYLKSGYPARVSTAPLTLSNASPGAQPPLSIGKDSSKVVVEEFADFQCPPCKRLHAELKRVETDYAGQVRFVFRQLPLTDLHEHALEAAQAAEAAALQGRFKEMRDILFEKQSEWETAPQVRSLFSEYASSIGLDVGRFQRDFDSSTAKERIALDQKRAESAHIEGTPSLFVNGIEVPGDKMDEQGIRSTISSAVNAVR